MYIETSFRLVFIIDMYPGLCIVTYKGQGPSLKRSFNLEQGFNYPAVRTGSSNTHFFFFRVLLCFSLGYIYLPQIYGFWLAKQMLVTSFATQARARILSYCN